MSDKTGYFFVVDEPERVQVLERHIVLNGTFTDVVSARDWNAKASEVFLLSLGDDELHYAALVRRGNQVATGKHQLRFTQLHRFNPPIPIEQIQSRISSRFQNHLLRSSQGTGTPVPRQTWLETIEAIKAIQPEASQPLSRLFELRDFSSARFFDQPGALVVAQERDATNLALRMAGFDPSPILDWSPPPNTANAVAPFLKGLPSARVQEDQIIAHDAKVFGTWEQISNHVVGTTVFQSGRSYLTVMNANRHDLEHVLGVDLLYYVHDYRAYVLVQYKRMVRTIKGDFEFRPGGKSYVAEMQRMRKFKRAFPRGSQIDQVSDYRLNRGPFYFKLCPDSGFDPTSTEMFKGMYLPLDYWEMLVKSDQVRGQRGGIRVTFENSGRYFNNTEFVLLVQSGWIGSHLIQTDAITDYATAAIADRRSVVFAAKIPLASNL